MFWDIKQQHSKSDGSGNASEDIFDSKKSKGCYENIWLNIYM